MHEILSTLLESAAVGRHITVFFLVLARWVPLTVLAPFFAARAMPGSARLGSPTFNRPGSARPGPQCTYF